VRNQYLERRTAADIDQQIAKILRGLGNPEPPLRLEEVRALLQLDRQYFSTTEEGALRELVSRAQIAGRQLLQRPTLILEVVRKWDLKALYLPDRQRILLDAAQPQPKWRWNEAHEIIHSLVPWHDSVMHGDTLYTLSPECHAQIEAEANYGAGRLLCMQEKFEAFAQDSSPSFAMVQAASKLFQNTMTSSLWRLVEVLEIPALGVVSQHPHYLDADFDANEPCRYFIRSRPFVERFSQITEQAVFALIQSYCAPRRADPLGTEDLLLTDDAGGKHRFLCETFHNRHEALTLITYQGPYAPAVAVLSGR
jgi:hypothetical protein